MGQLWAEKYETQFKGMQCAYREEDNEINFLISEDPVLLSKMSGILTQNSH